MPSHLWNWYGIKRHELERRVSMMYYSGLIVTIDRCRLSSLFTKIGQNTVPLDPAGINLIKKVI